METLEQKLRSFALGKTDLCDCDQIDTSEHKLFHCPIYEEERRLLNEKIEGELRPWPIANVELVRPREIFEIFKEKCYKISCKKEASRR